MEISSTTDGPRFFDLEKSVLDTNVKISKDGFSRLQQEEVDGLEKEGSYVRNPNLAIPGAAAELVQD
jgi:hypothetical protein